jgi:predicted ATPase
MVGRRQEMADIRALMTAHRLVTLTGTAGVGKTRMCLEVARAVRRTFSDGVWFVELASLRDPQLVARVVLDTLRVANSSAREPGAVLAEYLRDRQALIVLDNCEHVLPEASSLVQSLLSSAPGVRLLATSRQPLGLPGERSYRLKPLPLPDAAARNGQDVFEYAAIELFASRATAAFEDFRVGPENRQAVVEVCRTLEGLPLAVELAASRVKVMSVTELLRRLDDRSVG